MSIHKSQKSLKEGRKGRKEAGWLLVQVGNKLRSFQGFAAE